MMFEYDKNKSHSNLIKHGIDFEHAQKLWNDYYLIEISINIIGDENRILCVAKYQDKHWTAVILKKKMSIRIISVRSARKKEVDLYEYYRRRV